MIYRPDIDGLRAVAVLAVFAFHAEISRVPGGFVGVDVFFVISGYLISSIILHDLAGGRFSLARFYERRIRRILPALFLVLTVCTLVAFWVLLPPRMEHFGGSMVAAALSVSNILFWTQSSYFDDALKNAPLLHTWSLGVEEQFYVVWPLLLMALRGLGARLVWVVAAVVAGSFALAVHGVARTPDAAFYLLPARAWELALGGLIACPAVRLPRLGERAGRWLREGMAAAGLAMIAWSCLAYSPTTPFPGIAAVPPCLGAACIILAGRDGGSSVTARLLGLGPVVLVGKISYSLYLWHWPLIVFKKALFLEISAIGTVDKLAVIAAGMVLAWVSWRFVEQPFRDGRRVPGRAAAFRFAGGGVAGAAVAGGLLVLAGGVPWRFPAAVAETASYLTRPGGGGGTCFVGLGPQAARLDAAACLTPDPARPNILLFGDSHADHLNFGLKSVLRDARLLVATGSGCRPLIEGGTPPGAPGCGDMKAMMFGTFLPHNRVDLVILAAAWKAGDRAALQATVEALARMGQRTVVVGPIVMYDTALPELLAAGMLRGRADFAAPHELAGQRAIDAALRADLARWRVRYISLQELLCREGACLRRAPDGAPLQFDYGHLTRSGSITVAELMLGAGLLGAGP